MPWRPSRRLVPQVWDEWQRVEQLLDGRQSLSERAHLTLLGGQLTYFLSRLSFNLGDCTAARRHAALAWQYVKGRRTGGVMRFGDDATRSRSTLDSTAGPSTTCELPSGTTIPTTAPGSPPTWRGCMRCWAGDRMGSKRSPRWSVILSICQSSRETRRTLRRPGWQPWRPPSSGWAMARSRRAMRVKLSPYMTCQASGTPRSRTGATRR
jgi:hypothetical protein